MRYTIEGEGKEQEEFLADVIMGFFIALFCIYALLAIPFKSFAQPFVVMAAVLFGIVGTVVGKRPTAIFSTTGPLSLPVRRYRRSVLQNHLFCANRTVPKNI